MTDGGPAFPRQALWMLEEPGYFREDEGTVGMSLRDYFAGQAMIGTQIVAAALAQIAVENEKNLTFTSEQMAHAAYDMADAMLKARGHD